MASEVLGDEAPDFELRSHRGGTVKLSDFRGRQNVVHRVSPAGVHAGVRGADVRLRIQPARGSSRTGRWCSASASTRSRRRPPGRRRIGPISYDLLSDFHPHGEVAQKYGVFRPKEGFSERAIFVVDKQGRIAWSKIYEIPEQPKNDEVFEALEAEL